MNSLAAGPTSSAINPGAFSTGIEIGGEPIAISSQDPRFIEMLEDRYAKFSCDPARAINQIEVEIVETSVVSTGADLEVSQRDGRWRIERGDFIAEWDSSTGRGTARQTANHYSLDTLLRVIHSLLLADGTGFLLHSASSVRRERAFLFSGVSGAGKTTISRLAPPDATLLSDEISYVRQLGGQYRAFGTPFAGELATPGENVSAPIEALYFLAQGPANVIRRIAPQDSLRRLMRNILFFALDSELVEHVFRGAADFIAAVPNYELTFKPDAEVWDLVT